MSEASLFHDAIKYGEAASHLRHILVTSPDICIDRLTAEPCTPECAHCRKTIHGGLRNDAETEAEAVERILYRGSRRASLTATWQDPALPRQPSGQTCTESNPDRWSSHK